MQIRYLAAVALLAGQFAGFQAFADEDLPTKFSNRTSILNTRHNLTQRPPEAGPGGTLNGIFMDATRNDYGQVCVYCHTPHGANRTVQAPLWNRTIKATTYTLYNQLSLSQQATQPGPSSLTCLSCHDGQVAVDSIVNMPGSGKYNAAQETEMSGAWLSGNWTNQSGITPGQNAHNGLKEGTGCLSCHSDPGASGATDFRAFAIGTDLTNDHPIGVKLPSGADWKVPGNVSGNVTYFDTNGDSKLSKGDVRFYDSGGGPEVECASCHDPHGVPGNGAGTNFNPTFLRVSNDGSGVCLTCHAK